MKRRSFEEADLIRLNLQRFDVQTRREPLIDRIFSSAPILPLTLAFIVGISFAYRINSLQTLRLVMAGVLLVVGVCLCVPFKKNVTTRFFLMLACSFLMVFLLATIRCYSIRYTPPNHITHLLLNDRELATIKGTVVSHIRTDAPSEGISSIPWLSSQSSFYVEADGIKSVNGWHKTCGKIRVQVAEPVRHIQPGNTVQIYCWLGRFEGPPNPGQFNMKKYMDQQGVYVAASVSIAEGIEVIEASDSLLWKMRSFLYHQTCDALIDETMTDRDVKSLASALLLGRRDNLNPQLMAAFQDTNLAHFISLSGMHVGILAGSLWILLRTAGLAKRPRAILCIVLILTYALIVPPRAPTLRAIFLSCFFFGSVLFKRRPSPLNTLALSALVLLLIRPWELYSAGWQLSFMSVLGIILFYPDLKYHLSVKFFYPVVSYLPNRIKRIEPLVYSVTELLAVGLSVWITIAPILLYYFGRVNPLSWLWTLLVLPFVVLLLYAGFLKILFTALLPTIAALLGGVFNLAAAGFEILVMALSKVDVIQAVSYRPGLVLVFTIYLLMIVICLVEPWFWKTRRIILSLILLCFVYPSISQYFELSRRNSLVITCLSVGHGQCSVLSGPENEKFLFDAGSITQKNIGSKIVLPFLQHQNIFSLDRIYLSHGDLDHINAVPDIAAAIKTHTIFANQTLLNQSQSPSLEKQLRENLMQMDRTLERMRSYSSSKGLTIKSIWPDPDAPQDSSVSENDTSEVFLIEYAGRKMLLCGDIERYAQKQLTELFPYLKVDVLLLPHHGSVNNLDPAFVEFFSPRFVIASCSDRTVENGFHPSTESSTDAFYTARDGAVTIKIKADGTLYATGFLSR